MKPENLNKNGSYVERRKMYVEFPFHNMQSKLPIDWQMVDRESQQKNRMKSKQILEQQYIRRRYNHKIQQKLRAKYNSSIDTSRVVPNQITLQKDNDILTKQLEQFNSSKVQSGSNFRANPQYRQPSKSSKHQTYSQNKQQYHNDPNPQNYYQYERQNYRGQQSPMPTKISHLQYENTSNPYPNSLPQQYRLSPNDRYYDPYVSKKMYEKDLMKQYWRYAEMTPGNAADPRFKNVLPDRLEEFLRQKTKSDRKHEIHVSLNMSKHQKNI